MVDTDSGRTCNTNKTKIDPIKKSRITDFVFGNSFFCAYSLNAPKLAITAPPKNIPYKEVAFIRRLFLATDLKKVRVFQTHLLLNARLAVLNLQTLLNPQEVYHLL